MVAFSLGFKSWLSQKYCQVFNECQFSTTRWQCSTSLQMKWFVLLWIFWMMEMKSDEEYILRGRGMLSLTLSVSLIVTVTDLKKVLKRWTHPKYPRVVGVVVEEKCDVVERVSTRVVVVAVRERFSLVTSAIWVWIRGHRSEVTRLVYHMAQVFVYCCILTTVDL